jgi:hypothetical protein
VAPGTTFESTRIALRSRSRESTLRAGISFDLGNNQVVTLALSTGASAQSKFKTIQKFNQRGGRGCAPIGGLVFDAAGNLYGTTRECGWWGHGVVFKLTPNSNGSWTEKVLVVMSGDFSFPQAGLTINADGNLYGSALGHGYGSVFELKKNPDGSWGFSVLRKFGNGVGGGYPAARCDPRRGR